MKIKFNTNQIIINDDAGLQTKMFVFLSALNLLNFLFQTWSKWNEFDNPLLYLFLVFSVLMLMFLIYYLFYNSSQEIIEHEQIQYFKIKNILGLKLRYFKLTDGKTRLLYFKGKSNEISLLKDHLKQNNLPVFS
ncbi:hypothetical protein [Flavobacteriaceae bacterium 14752]|uniref:hypothetical protein n=1 Tax=Mesohalobacter salilacus TaxID=2491711 RepID=UPI000F634FD0|nr:hypothetical protein EIG84_07375 [Flavobacteriaceae bacterium 14752]